jgi:type IV secretory pathway VirB10-like protein
VNQSQNSSSISVSATVPEHNLSVDIPAAPSTPQLAEEEEQLPPPPPPLQEEAAPDTEMPEQLAEEEELAISLGGPDNDDPGGDTSERNGEVARSELAMTFTSL